MHIGVMHRAAFDRPDVPNGEKERTFGVCTSDRQTLELSLSAEPAANVPISQRANASKVYEVENSKQKGMPITESERESERTSIVSGQLRLFSIWTTSSKI